MSVPGIMLSVMKRMGMILILVLAAAGLSGCGPEQPTAMFTCVKTQVKPTDFTPYCADAGQLFSKVSWSYWGAQFANGTGKVATNLCEPTCSAGKTDISDADVTLDKPVKVGQGQVFSELIIKYHDKVGTHPLIEKLQLATAPMGQ